MLRSHADTSHPELICWRAEAAGRDTVMVNFEFSNDGDTAKALACFHCIITKNGTCEFVGICTVKIHAVGPGEEANIEVKMNTSEKAKSELPDRERMLTCQGNLRQKRHTSTEWRVERE